MPLFNSRLFCATRLFILIFSHFRVFNSILLYLSLVEIYILYSFVYFITFSVICAHFSASDVVRIVSYLPIVCMWNLCESVCVLCCELLPSLLRSVCLHCILGLLACSISNARNVCYFFSRKKLNALTIKYIMQVALGLGTASNIVESTSICELINSWVGCKFSESTIMTCHFVIRFHFRNGIFIMHTNLHTYETIPQAHTHTQWVKDGMLFLNTHTHGWQSASKSD